MEIEYVTHASLLLSTPEAKLLVDPFFFPEDDPILAPSVRNFPPRAIDPSAWGTLDYVFSSHEHHDHCHPQTLARLRDRVRTVLLPAERPNLAARYLELGFPDIRYLENRRPVALAGGLEVVCIWDDPVDSMLLVRMGGKTILHANDCLAEPRTYAEIARRGAVDYAFICSTSIQQLYPLLLPLGEAELDAAATAREDEFFDGQIPRIDALGARVVIPYSYTASYLAPGQVHLNGIGRLTPTMFRERLRARRPRVECWSLQPGDVIDAGANRVRPVRDRDLWGRDLAEFRANVAEHARAVAAELPPFDAGDPETCADAVRRHLEERVAGGVPHAGFFAFLDRAVVLHLGGNRATRSFRVDLARRAVTEAAGPALLEITVPASLMESMLAGAYDPFMILYTYRIAFRAHPSLAARLGPGQQFIIYLGAFLTLFVGRDSPLLEECAKLESYLGPPSGVTVPA